MTADYLVTVEPKVKAANTAISACTVPSRISWKSCPKGIDKARSLARLLEVLGLDWGADDSLRRRFQMSLTMIKYAGLGVAMENAVLPRGQAADYITASNNHDGVDLWLRSSCCPERDRKTAENIPGKVRRKRRKMPLIKSPSRMDFSDFNMLK